MPRGDAATARLHRDWLRNLPALTGKPLTRLAQEIKIAPSTLTRPLKEGDDGTSTLHANTIAKVVAHTHVAPPGELGAPPPGRRPARGFGEEAAPFVFSTNYDAVLEAALKALAGESNSIAPWQLRTRAVELAGFLPGDVLLLDLNATPKPGDLVCAQVYDWQHMKAETVVRIFDRAAPVELLLARSFEHYQPLVVDGERVTIKGVFLPHRLRPQAV